MNKSTITLIISLVSLGMAIIAFSVTILVKADQKEIKPVTEIQVGYGLQMNEHGVSIDSVWMDSTVRQATYDAILNVMEDEQRAADIRKIKK